MSLVGCARLIEGCAALTSGVFTNPRQERLLFREFDAMAKRLSAGCALLVLLLLATARAGVAVTRFDTAEIVLRSTSSYNANSGTPNPFTAVDLTARVTAPSGRIYTIDGFFDGDGNGGSVGN